MTYTRAQDRLDIVEACNLFGWYADRRDWAHLVELLTEELYLDYTGLSGGEPGVLSGSEVVAKWAQDFARFTATQHLIGNHVVDLAGDRALCRCHFQAVHVASQGGTPWVLGGDYRFGLVRSVDGWKIDAITMTPIWSTGDGGVAVERDTRATATAWFERVCGGDIEAAAALLAPNVEWINFSAVPGHHDCMPWIGTYHGPEAVLASFEEFIGVCEVRHKQLRELVVDGEHAVGVVHEIGMARRSGVPFEIEYVERLTVRNGRIVRWKSYTDPCSIIHALQA